MLSYPIWRLIRNSKNINIKDQLPKTKINFENRKNDKLMIRKMREKSITLRKYKKQTI